MPPATSTTASANADYAAWLDWAQGTSSRHLDPSWPGFRVLHETGLNLLGIDILRGRFAAGTPCSATHLVWSVTHGSVSVDFGEGPVIFAKGCLAVCPALRPHWVRLVSKSARGVWFHLRRVPRWQHLSHVGPGVHHAKYGAEMEWLLDHCLREIGSNEFGSNTNALHYAEILSVLLEREIAGFAPRPNAPPGLKRFERLLGDIMVHPGKPWSVALMAKSAGVSSRELHRLCNRMHGVGPMGLVTRMRMDRAMELLLSSPRKIEDVAREVGYGTAHAFSEVFLAHVGKRPGGFRNSHSHHPDHPTP